MGVEYGYYTLLRELKEKVKYLLDTVSIFL